MQTSRAIRQLAALLALLTAVHPAAAQTGPEEAAPGGDTPLFVERVDVNVVNVEVFVRDRQGRQITGLTKDDFEILHDGEPMEISNFFTASREIRTRPAERLETDAAAVAATAPAELPELELPSDQRLSLLVFVDNAHLAPANRQRLLEQLDGFLEDSVRQGHRVMLASYLQARLEVVQPFTRDRGAIRDGIARLGRTGSGRVADQAELRRTMLSMRMFAQGSEGERSGPQPEAALDALRSYVQLSRQRLLNSLKGLDVVVRSMAGMPGRKAVLYVSDGLPRRPGEELYEYMVQLFGQNRFLAAPGTGEALTDPSIDALREDAGPLFDKIVREANTHQVTFYTLDASGSAGTVPSAALSGSLDAGPTGLQSVEQVRDMNLKEPLIDLADGTGGRSILNTSNFDDALETMSSDFASFYSLGFRTPGSGDGAFHRLEVRVEGRPELIVRHRTGYEDKPQGERVADRTLSSLLHDFEHNPLGVTIAFGEAQKKSRGVYHLPMLVRVPVDNVTLLPSGETHRGRLKFFLAVKDDEGRVSPMHEEPYPVEVPTELVAGARGKELAYATTLKVRPGRPKVAVAVWDEVSGEEAFVHKQALVDGNGDGR